jgi:hypothetical protein
MIRHALTGDTALVQSGEMPGRTQTLSWWPEEKGAKTTEKKIHWPRWVKVKPSNKNPMRQ